MWTCYISAGLLKYSIGVRTHYKAHKRGEFSYKPSYMATQ
jgi:hypothetical protein